jgi:hypothetical protein
MITPTPGRVVWYRTAGQEQALAATVAGVLAEDRVNLTVHDFDGRTFAKQNVKLWQGDGEPPAMPYAEWMPYQKAQAEKDEGIVGKVKKALTK